MLNELISQIDAWGIETRFEYNDVGRLTKRVNAFNSERQTETRSAYDNIGQLTSITDAMDGVASYQYNEVGNKTKITDPGEGVTRYFYDSMERETEFINAIGKITSYNYNSLGLLESIINPRGQETTYTYLKNGWIESYTDELGTVSFTYDSNGNTLTVTDRNGTITREYDEMNRVIKHTDFRGNTIKYGYNQFGNIVKLEYPDGQIVRYDYYKTGDIKSVTDWDGGVTRYSYDANERLTKTTRPDGSVETRSYDNAGQMVSQINKNGETVINSQQYEWNESGNIINVSVYDPMQFAGTVSAEMEYNEFNQLIRWNGEDILYDESGNMLYGPFGGGMVEFEYDCRNRLIRAGDIQYEYDAGDNRIAKIVNGVRTDFVHDTVLSLSRILMSTINDETIYYVWGQGLISQEFEDKWLFYHFNNIGSTQAITDINGEIIERFEYDPYGRLISNSEYGILFLYNGQFGIVTDDNGLLHMRARYYNPEIMRFINPDPIKDGWSWYVYASGDPINMFDPFGLYAKCSQGPNWKPEYDEFGECEACKKNDLIEASNWEASKDSFGSIKAAVKDFAKTINGMSIEKNWEYGTTFYKKGKKFHYTKPHTNKLSNAVCPTPRHPSGTTLEAIGHTHGAYDDDGSDKFSNADKNMADFFGVPAYLVTPNGSIKKYNPNRLIQQTAVENISNSFNWTVPHDGEHPNLNHFLNISCKRCR